MNELVKTTSSEFDSFQSPSSVIARSFLIEKRRGNLPRSSRPPLPTGVLRMTGGGVNLDVVLVCILYFDYLPLGKIVGMYLGLLSYQDSLPAKDEETI